MEAEQTSSEQSHTEKAIRRIARELRSRFGPLVEDEDAIDWRWMAERVLATVIGGYRS